MNAIADCVRVLANNQADGMQVLIDERTWMDVADVGADRRLQKRKIIVSRWITNEWDFGKYHRGNTGEYHAISINLKSTRLILIHGEQPIHAGFLSAGAVHVAGPGKDVTILTQEPCEILRICLTELVLSECFENAFGRPPSRGISLDNPQLIFDPTIERLGAALLNSSLPPDDAFTGVYAASLATAVACRVLGRHYLKDDSKKDALSQRGLPLWRVNRAIEFIDGNLDRAIKLSDIAHSVGLSRMYFAAQFRAATGVRPRDFLRRRRIERAQSLLSTTDTNTLDIAISTGFRSQAHFTTVFKTVVGMTPARWRAGALKVKGDGDQVGRTGASIDATC